MESEGARSIEMRIEAELEEHFADDVDVIVYRQGDSLDVEVEFPRLEDTLSGVVGSRSIQPYSNLKFTVPRR